MLNCIFYIKFYFLIYAYYPPYPYPCNIKHNPKLHLSGCLKASCQKHNLIKNKEFTYRCSLFKSQFTRGECRWDGSGEAVGVRFKGGVRFRAGDLLTGVVWNLWCSRCEFRPAFLGASICSRVARTSVIGGLALASLSRHFRASVAAMKAPFCGYCPSNLESMIRNSLRLSPKYGFAQSTRFWSTPAIDLSTARLPDKSSSRTTPKLYTSLFAVSRPVNQAGL